MNMLSKILILLALVLQSQIVLADTEVHADVAHTEGVHAEAAHAQAASCTSADQTHLHHNNHNFAEAMHACSGFRGLDIKCFDQKYPGLTANCVQCYAKMAECGVSHCVSRCMFNSRGPDCRACSKEHCGKSLEKCAGITFENSPDIARN